MKVVVLTGIERGFPSLCLPELAARGVEVAMVVLAEAPAAGRAARARRILRKVRRIGVRGAWNGLRMRRWYRDDVAALLSIQPLKDVCGRLGVAMERTPSVNHERTAELVRSAGADLGLVLGTTWVAPGIFAIPRLGMVNVHHERLPEFRGAQSVIWSLHAGLRTTAYTIHQIDAGLDTAPILDIEERPILFRPTLGATVTATYADLLAHSAVRLAEVVADYDRHAAAARPQGPGRTCTTPTWREFREVRRRWEEMSTAGPPR